METASEMAIRIVAEEMAAWEREDREVSVQLTRRCTGSSVPYAIRLGPEELGALQRRADSLDMKPTVLARSLIRAGLMSCAGSRPIDPRVTLVLDRIGADLAELRALLT